MDKFPKTLSADNKDNFSKLHHNVVERNLRLAIYEHIISHEENQYFDLETFNRNNLNNMEKMIEITTSIVNELENLGWKCAFSFGQTALFVFSDQPPQNYFPDGF